VREPVLVDRYRASSQAAAESGLVDLPGRVVVVAEIRAKG
jgi:hypothetical protein